MAKQIQRGSGNVFADAGFPPDEAAHLQIRSQLMVRIELLIKEMGLTQTQAAKALGVTQPRVSDVVRGRLERFSIDTLVDMLARLGVTVTVRTGRAARLA